MSVWEIPGLKEHLGRQREDISGILDLSWWLKSQGALEKIDNVGKQSGLNLFAIETFRILRGREI